MADLKRQINDNNFITYNPLDDMPIFASSSHYRDPSPNLKGTSKYFHINLDLKINVNDLTGFISL